MGAGAVKYGLDARESLIESGKFCRSLTEGNLGRVQLVVTKLELRNLVLGDVVPQTP
jgi:hypothetical protein